MSVDLPAPFSPSSACTSPWRSSRSTRSFATSEPKRLVMPRSSSASGALELRVVPAGCVSPVKRALLDHAGRNDLSGLDQCLHDCQLGEDRLRHAARRRGDVDAALLEAEDAVLAAVVLARLEVADRQVDGLVDLLDGRGEDLRADGLLVVVDADAPDLLLAGRVERAEAAAAGDLEHDVRARGDLRLGEALALGLVGERARVAVERLDARVALLGA